MTKFDELRVAFKDWRKCNIDYHDTSIRFANAFASGFQKYIDAPETYKENQTKHRYIEARQFTEYNLLVTPKNMRELLTLEDDGFFKFGLLVTLEYDERTYPKGPFGFTIHFQLKDDACEMRLGDKVFKFSLADEAGCYPVYDDIVETLKVGLSRKPWEGSEKRKIGFLPLSD